MRNVHGLQPYLHPRKSIRFKKEDALPDVHRPPYLVADILSSYYVNGSGETGAGEQIGIIIDAMPLTIDLTQFWNDNSVAQSLANIDFINVRNSALPAPSSEETLDVAWSNSLAPEARIVVYACGGFDYINNAYSRILDDLQSGVRPGLHQISMSYGAGEQTEETPDDINSTHECSPSWRPTASASSLPRVTTAPMATAATPWR